jgi:hypothetical protein
MVQRAIPPRIHNLLQHLQAENPLLVSVLDPCIEMDDILIRMKLVDRDDGLAVRVSWWPIVSLVGVFSSGKSTFINDYLGLKILRTGNQAVDDKFTVICYGKEPRVLPGTALDADVRFPFYRMGDEVEKVAAGEGKMIDNFLQLRAIPSDRLKGLILVDSPGFDSDECRTATLRLVDHIINLSDLTLVFFDARHPEPRAMQDTLTKVVAKTYKRPDADKFLYVLNQIDTAAGDNNIEDIVGAWQRALSSAGLTAGNFFTIYSDSARIEIKQPEIAARFKEMSDRDLAEIHARIDAIGTIRPYRVASAIEAAEKDVREEVVPLLQRTLDRWRRMTGLYSVLAVVAVLVVLGLIAFAVAPNYPVPSVQESTNGPLLWPIIGLIVIILLLWLAIHSWVGQSFAARIARSLPETYGTYDLRIRRAFLESARFPAFLRKSPIGWSRRTESRIARLRSDLFTRPGASTAE